MENLYGPYGFTLAAVCIGVVFAALLILCICYTVIGKIFVYRADKGVAMPSELPQPLPEEEPHDTESGMITINRSNQPYGELPAPVIIPLNVKLGHASAHREEYLMQSAPQSHQHTISSGTVICPLPGVIIGISVKVGDSVVPGQRVATLEAMKMENAIEAEKSGVIKAIHVNVGDSVLEGAKIVTIA